MKKSLFLKLLLVTFFVTTLNSLVSCSVHVHERHVHKHKHKRIPPGHEKKIYGDKSAKKYAKKKHKHKHHD